MIDILDKYKNRLINISGRNRSLVSKKLYKKRALDLHKLSKYNELLPSEIVDYIWQRDSSQLEIVKDHVRYIKDETQIATEKLKDEESKAIKNIKQKKFSRDEEEEKIKLISEKYKKELEEKILNIEKLGERLEEISNNINYLLREINALEKETGRYELFIGYPFVEGKFRDGTFVKAPLFLFPITVRQNNGNWYLENIINQEIILNKVFLLAFSKFNKENVDWITTEYYDLNESFKNIQEAIEYLSDKGIEIEFKNQLKVEKFKEIKKDTVIPYKNGEMQIVNNLILGQFPVANSIYNDYIDLINIYQNEDDKKNLLLNKLLINDKQYYDLNLNDENLEYRNKKFSEKDFYFISSLDYSQENAVKTVNETDQLVIYGPPGTGKSQAISNIIADSMAKNKKVLMVSQKKAALDVIYNRVGNLNSKTILLHDANKDKKKFYEKVALELENQLLDEHSDLNRKIRNRAEKIDNEIDKLTKLQEVLIKEREFGINLQQMYSISKSLDSNNNKKYNRYRVFRKNNFAKKIDYYRLKDIKENLTENTWLYYKKYKDYNKENPELSKLKLDMDLMDVEDYIESLEKIINKYSTSINVKIEDEKYIKDFYEVYTHFDKNITNEEIDRLSERINKRENSIFLNPIEKDEFIRDFKEKKNNFNVFFSLYNELDDVICEDKIVELSKKINREDNIALLNPLSKETFIKENKNVNVRLGELLGLYNELEDIIDLSKVDNLANETNKEENGYLLGALKKEDYIKSIEVENKKYFSDFFNLYGFLEERVEQDKIIELAEEINEKENAHLLVPIEYGNWWTISYWKNKKINKQKEIDNKNKFEKRKEQIINLMLSYNEEIKKYIIDTKKDNNETYKRRYVEICNEYNKSKEFIDLYIKEEKERNISEYEKREKAIFDELITYKKEIEKYVAENKFKNEQEYRERYKAINEILLKYKEKVEEFREDIRVVELFIAKEYIKELKDKVYLREDIKENINRYLNGLKVYNKYLESVVQVKAIPEFEKRYLKYIYEFGQELNFESVVNEVFEFVILYNINEIEKREQSDLLVYKDFDEIVTRVNELMSEKQKLVPEYILSELKKSFSCIFTSHSKQYIKEFNRQASKKRMLWPIRKYIDEFSELLLELFPCWLLSPETVSEILPLDNSLFDLIIFDEASQMFIENAIPTIYRGKKVVIAGDDKQLKPTSMFKSKIDNEDEVDENEVAAALEEESLLDLAKVNYDSVYLNYHYRSKYDELINFSNYAFYGGKLEVAPNTIKTDITDNKPIERIKVDGRWIDRKNIKEAEKVVKLVKEILLNREKKETIGIITFNITQQDLIEDYLEAECEKDPLFRKLYIDEKNRIENNEDVSIFIKNIENVQGDERDIIIFSVGYAKNEKDKISLNFGSLSQDGGENRLNVAISRAKEKIYVVTSIEPEQLGNVDNTKNNGPKLFKKYLEYVKYVSEGDKRSAKVILNSLLDSDISRNTKVKFDSPFEEEVYKELVKRGLSVDTQIGVSGYKIDLGIYDEITSKYKLGIECDGSAYHSSKEARERDIHRQRYLESRGWKIYRIWSRDWWSNSDEIIEDILNQIK